MNRREEAALTRLLEELPRDLKQEIHEEARRRRNAAIKRDRKRRPRKSKRFDGHQWDEHSQSLGRPGPDREHRRPASLQDWVLKVLAERQEALGKRQGTASEGHLQEGLVLAVGARLCTVRSDEGEDLSCVLSAELADTQQTSLAVGDRVTVEVRSTGDCLVTLVHPRSSRLSRPDITRVGVERVLVANVDVVVVVASLVHPPLRPRLIDRYLIAIERGGARPILVVNKCDLADAEPEAAEALALLEPYEALDLRVLRCSAETGEGLAALRDALAGKLCAFVGHSGVGKSSLINTLCPGLGLRVGRTNEVIGRGRHTTTRSTLHEAANRMRVIDTPGVRSFGLLPMEAAELQWYFPEFDGPASACRFNDCSHVHEPDCGVMEAVERGEVIAVRYEAYLRILDSIDEPL